MNFNSIKQTVFRAASLLSFDSDDTKKNHCNRVLTVALTINIIEKLISQDKSYVSKVSELAKNYVNSYKSQVIILEDKYSTYNEMRYYIEEQEKIESALYLTQPQVKHLVDLYNNKLEIKEVSTSSYSHLMYNISKLKYTDNLRLKKLHFNLFVPIIKHYMVHYGILTKDIKLDNILFNSPGKVVDIKIRGVEAVVIKSDIDSDVMNISKYVYDSEITEDGKIRITTMPIK